LLKARVLTTAEWYCRGGYVYSELSVVIQLIISYVRLQSTEYKQIPYIYINQYTTKTS